MNDLARITVYGGMPTFGVADLSPFCLKVKTYLRMTRTPYSGQVGDPRNGPTKKVPYITMDGATVGDSGLIIEHLKNTLGDPLDARLSPEERALGHVVRRTLEESLYWCLVQARWADDTVWPAFSTAFRRMLPPVVGGVIMGLLRGKAQKALWAQGIARHTKEGRESHGRGDINSLATLLGDKAYLFGDAPTSFDASLYATMSSILAFPPEGYLAKQVRSHANLTAFVDRVNTSYWVDRGTL